MIQINRITADPEQLGDCEEIVSNYDEGTSRRTQNVQCNGYIPLDDSDVGVKESVDTVGETGLLLGTDLAVTDLGDALLEAHVGELVDGGLNLGLGVLSLDELKDLLSGALVEAGKVLLCERGHCVSSIGCVSGAD